MAVLRLEEVAKPVPKEDEVLIKVHATTVNRTDCGIRAATPFIARFFTGLRQPRRRILGTELAGEVEGVGAAVTEFAIGDRVFGISAWLFGAHAEYICMRESAALATMPAGMSFEEAAAVCDGGILALMGMRPANVRKGQRVLIYGASGSIGTAGVQLAKYFGADITAVCSTKNVELVRSLGADRVIDYTQADVLFLRGLIEAGRYRPVIDRCYPLESVVEATRYVETWHKTGNVVLTVNKSNQER